MTPTLRIDWATQDAARYATRWWHYSHAMPGADTVKLGAWEGDTFVGVVIFSRGATPEIGSRYGLKQHEVCELTRVALRDHVTPVSRIIAIALKFLRKRAPGLRLVVSFADTAQGHHGGIYQAGNWVYCGCAETHAYRIHGQLVHPKTLHSRYGKGGQSVPWLREHVDPDAARIVAGVKHRYLMPLDDDIRHQVEPLRQNYPKRAKLGDGRVQRSGGGATPTRTLHAKGAGGAS